MQFSAKKLSVLGLAIVLRSVGLTVGMNPFNLSNT